MKLVVVPPAFPELVEGHVSRDRVQPRPELTDLGTRSKPLHRPDERLLHGVLGAGTGQVLRAVSQEARAIPGHDLGKRDIAASPCPLDQERVRLAH